MKLPYKCPMCSRTFRTPQGRRGHLTFKHDMGKKSIYTEAIGKLITAHKEGMEHVKEKRKRKRLPQSVLSPEKRRKALEFARELEGEEPIRSNREDEWNEEISLKGLSELNREEERSEEGISLKGLRGRWLNGK